MMTRWVRLYLPHFIFLNLCGFIFFSFICIIIAFQADPGPIMWLPLIATYLVCGYFYLKLYIKHVILYLEPLDKKKQLKIAYLGGSFYYIGTIASALLWFGANRFDLSGGMSEWASLAIIGAIGTLGMFFASVLYTVFIFVAFKRNSTFSSCS